jgi:hypothetical protein
LKDSMKYFAQITRIFRHRNASTERCNATKKPDRLLSEAKALIVQTNKEDRFRRKISRARPYIFTALLCLGIFVLPAIIVFLCSREPVAWQLVEMQRIFDCKRNSANWLGLLGIVGYIFILLHWWLQRKR